VIEILDSNMNKVYKRERAFIHGYNEKYMRDPDFSSDLFIRNKRKRAPENDK